MYKIHTLLTLCSFLTLSSIGQTTPTVDLEAQTYAQAQYDLMSLDQKIGQLFMVATYSDGKNYNRDLIEKLIKNYNIGGLIFMQGSIDKQLPLSAAYQDMSKRPLLIAMDAEWGLGMRLKGVKDLAKNIQIGATRDEDLSFKVGKLIAVQCKSMGVHIDFGPVVDINNNPNNPVINFRSFGENKEVVTSLGRAYSQGLESAGVMSCLKHFPGHGDTDVDSHKDLPNIGKSYEVLWDNELYPFRKILNQASSAMIAHLTVPAITKSNSRPTTLSHECVQGLLKDKMGFEGLVFTDALNMQGVAKYYQTGEVDKLAFMAGNDVLLFSQDVPKAISYIRSGIEDGSISEQRLKESVLKILEAKYKYVIKKRPSPSQNPSQLLQQTNLEVTKLNDEIARASITLARDKRGIFKSKSPASKIIYVALGANSDTRSIVESKGIKYLSLKSNTTTSQIENYLKQWASYDKIIVGVHGVHKYPSGRYGLSTSLISTANSLATQSDKVAILVNGNPYALKYFCDAPTLIVNYQDTDYNLRATLAAVVGEIPFKGKLPVTVCSDLTEGAGIVAVSSSPAPRTIKNTRAKAVLPTRSQDSKTVTQPRRDEGRVIRASAYSPKRKDTNRVSLKETMRLAREKFLEQVKSVSPTEKEETQLKKTEAAPSPSPPPPAPTQAEATPEPEPRENYRPNSRYNFSRVDQMVQNYMNQGVFPGCQILVAKNGKVVHYKSYGYHTYVGIQKVQNTHVYDIASVTKIAATTLAVMKLHDEGKLSLDAKLSQYLPMVRNTNKANITIRSLLLHEAGLVAWIPFYKECMNDDKTYKPGTLTHSKSIAYPITVAHNLYINKDYPDRMWYEILGSDVGAHRYKYSDLDFLFLQKVVESITKQPLDEYVANTFYKPLRLTRIGYNPKERGWIPDVMTVPTERDQYFRMQLVNGYVHDQCAAMLGGVAGHAGLFSDGSSLFVLLQMLLNKGEFSGKKFFKPSTVELFTRRGSNISRRGLGFDKPETRRAGGPTGDKASPATFGHQGFTGTCVWADPKDDVVFIFLSNRVYPDADNKLISRLDVRTKLQDECYRIMGL